MCSIWNIKNQKIVKGKIVIRPKSSKRVNDKARREVSLPW